MQQRAGTSSASPSTAAHDLDEELPTALAAMPDDGESDDVEKMPDPLDYCTDEERKARKNGPWWWWSVSRPAEAEAALAYTVRATIAGKMSIRQAQAVTTAARALLSRWLTRTPGLQ